VRAALETSSAHVDDLVGERLRRGRERVASDGQRGNYAAEAMFRFVD